MAGSKGHGQARNLPKKRSKLDRTRWLYQKDGRDLGPFAPNEIRELLSQAEISEDTRIRETARTDWRRLDEVELFVDYLRELAKEREHAAEEKALDKAESRVRTVRAVPYMVLGSTLLLLLSVGGWLGWQRWQGSAPMDTSRYASALTMEVDVPTLATLGRPDMVDEPQWVSEEYAVRDSTPAPETRQAARRKARRAPSQPMTGSANDLEAPSDTGEVNEIEFGSSNETGRALTAGEVNTVRQKAINKLQSCTLREASRNNAFPGTTVRFTIASTGRLARVSIGQNGRRSPSFKSCVRRALGSIRVDSFDPGASGIQRTMQIPLHVDR